MCISSNETTWTMPGGQHGGQKLRVDLSLSIGENKDYYKVCSYSVSGEGLSVLSTDGSQSQAKLTLILAYGQRG